MYIAPDESNHLHSKEIFQLLSEVLITPIFVSNSKHLKTFVGQADAAENNPLIVIYMTLLQRSEVANLISLCKTKNLPSLAIVSPDDLLSMDTELNISDFIITPFIEKELITRSIFSVKRSRVTPEEDELIVRGDLTINPSNYEVLINNNRINLRFKEYELLLLLSSNPGRVYDRATLLNQIWGYDYFGGTRTVDVHIRRLRSKIEGNSEDPYIETIWNVGYRFRSSD